jgi:hypothetical protein
MKKIIIGSLLILGLIFISSSIYLLIPKAYIKFETSPMQVAVMIDNNGKHIVASGDTITIAPGKHSVTVFEDQFNPYNKNIDVKNGETYNFLVSLIGITDKAKEALDEPGNSAVWQRFYAQTQSEIKTAQYKLYPFLGELPIEARLYTISDCPTKKYIYNPIRLALCVDMTLTDDTEANIKSYALQNMEDHGITPDDNEIIWSVDGSTSAG